ncbi:hypothetical protein MO973_19850 [Paenibacillus sp. TRM 82003]|nr:hypothetical protein [Paenibacillus sp. TRM 82003]
MSNNIILGTGVFAIDGTSIGLTRGGGSFSIEREYKEIPADGDYGPVKGRIRKDRSVPKLVINALEVLPANIAKFYPAMNVATDGVAGTDTVTATLDIKETDYHTVTWTGKTKGGRSVVITLQNAVNLEGLDWSLVDKDELVPTLTYTGTYDETTRTQEPWSIEFAD